MIDESETAAVNTQALAEAFYVWPLPKSVCADRCATDPNYDFPRSGTNLLSVAEAKMMFDHLAERGLLSAAPAQPPLAECTIRKTAETALAAMTERCRVLTSALVRLDMLIFHDPQIIERADEMRKTIVAVLTAERGVSDA